MFNLSGLYAKAKVVYSNMGNGLMDLQKAIDDNPETSIVIAPSTNESGLVIQYGDARPIQRVSIYCDPAAKGRVDFFLLNSPAAGGSIPAPAPVTSNNQGSQFMKVSNTQLVMNSSTPASAPAAGPVALDKLTPTVSLVLDGSNGRGSIDFPPVTASILVMRWTPETAGQDLSIREVNSFGDLSLNDYELVSEGTPIGEGPGDVSKEDVSKDGKDKQGPPPVGELLPGKDPFLPGPVGFPPNLPNPLSP
jgi:hypothetical protein